MKRTRRKGLQIHAEQAVQAIHMLVSEGRIAAREVHAVLKRREKLLREVRERLTALGVEGFDLVARVRHAPKQAARKAGRKARRQVSAATRAAWATQGRYMSAVRRLPKAVRARIKAIRQKSGVKAAIAAAKRSSR